jgi:hypothetical protein
MQFLLIFFLLVTLLLAPAIPAIAQLVPPDGGGQETAVPELPIGTLSLLIAVGAGAVISGKLFRKKKK